MVGNYGKKRQRHGEAESHEGEARQFTAPSWPGRERHPKPGVTKRIRFTWANTRFGAFRWTIGLSARGAFRDWLYFK
jgi:hypothetical protein